jgi:hypothetical protein
VRRSTESAIARSGEGPYVVARNSGRMSRTHRKPLTASSVIVMAAVLTLTSLPEEGAAAAPRNTDAKCFKASDDVGVGRWWSTRLPPVEMPPDNHVEYRSQYPWRFSVSESDPRVIYIWNLWRAFKSTDGGCTWDESYNTITTASLPFADITDEIVSVQAPLLTDREAPTYMVVQRGPTPFLGTQAAGSDEWVIAPMTQVNGVPLTGRPIQFWVAPSDPNSLYLEMGTDIVLLSPEERSRLYASEDGGRTWELRTVFVPDEETATPDYGDFSCPVGTSPCPKVHVTAMQVHPEHPGVLWTGTYDGIFRSKDGGRSWRNVYRGTWKTFGPVDAIELVATPARPLRIGIFGVLATGWSEDAGRTWELRDVPMGISERTGRPLLAPIESAASSDRLHSLVLLYASGGQRQAQLMGPSGWTYVSPGTARCGAGNDGAMEQCLWHAAYVRGVNSYFAVERDGSDLWKLELRH